MNVQSIQVMLQLNIDSKSVKDIPFTKALLYNPDYVGLSGTEGFNDYPYISNNTKIPYDKLSGLTYLDKASFFFDKNIFQLKCADIDQEKDTDKWETLKYNTMHMLKLLFPTVVPINENVNSSFDSNIKTGSIFSDMKFSTDSIRGLMNYYKFSFVQYGGKEYTVSQAVWLDDVINNPEYSKLFDDFNAFQTWSLATLKKLLEIKKRLYVKMVDTCRDELTEKDRERMPSLNTTVISINHFDEKRAFGSGWKSLRELGRVNARTAKANKGQGHLSLGLDAPGAAAVPADAGAVSENTRQNRGRGQNPFAGLITTNITDELIKDLNGDVTSIGHLAWRVDYMDILSKANILSDAEKLKEQDDLTEADDKTKIASKAIELYKNYLTCKERPEQIKDVEDLKKQHIKIQDYIETIRVKQMNDAIETIVSEKGSTFSRPLQTLVKKLMLLEKENDDEVTAIVERIIDNKGKQTLPPKYSYLNEISEKMNKFSSEYRELSPPDGLKENDTQETLNDYVYRKTKAVDVKYFIDKVAKYKKTPTYDKTEFLYTGVVELRNDDAKLPGYLIHVQLDVLGGKLDPSTIAFARCKFSDKKLKRMFSNIRQNIKENGVIVKPGPFFNLDEMKVAVKSKAKSKTTAKNKPTKGGRRSNKRRI